MLSEEMLLELGPASNQGTTDGAGDVGRPVAHQLHPIPALFPACQANQLDIASAMAFDVTVEVAPLGE